MPRNLILVPVSSPTYERPAPHHAPKYQRNDVAYQKTQENLRERLYEIQDADTGEVLYTVNI